MKKTFTLLIAFLAVIMMSCQKSNILDVNESSIEENIPVRVNFVLSDAQTRSMHLPGNEIEDQFDFISMVVAIGADDSAPISSYKLFKKGTKYEATLPNAVFETGKELYFIANADLIDGFDGFTELGHLRSAKLPQATETGIDSCVLATKGAIVPVVSNGSVDIDNVILHPTVARLKLQYDNSVTQIDQIKINGTSKQGNLSGFFGSTPGSYYASDDFTIEDNNLNFHHNENKDGFGYYYVYPSDKEAVVTITIKGISKIVPIGQIKSGSSYSVTVKYGVMLWYDEKNNDVVYNQKDSSFDFPLTGASLNIILDQGVTPSYSDNWFRVVDANTKGTVTKKIVCDANNSILARSGKITFMKNGLSEEFTVRQEGIAIDYSDIANWMKYVDGTKYISQLSIPGTHNSATSTTSLIWAQCQSYSITDQLNWGVRVLDIRCGHVNNTFELYHGIINLNKTFESVMSECEQFLKNHPRETIIMFVKEDYTGGGNTRSFEQTFRERYLTQSYRSLFYLADKLPTLEQVRGKIVLIRRFSISGGSESLGISTSWQDNTTFTSDLYVKMVIQDKYSISGYSEIGKKWNIANSAFNATISGSKAEPQTMYINFLSASGTFLTPYSIAEGTGSNKGMNSYMREMLTTLDKSQKPCIGTVMMDYVVNTTITSQIIQLNYQ